MSQIDPTPEAVRLAIAAATTTARPNYAAAARALRITRQRLLALAGVAETRGLPRVPYTVEELREAVRVHGSREGAARALRISSGTIRNKLGTLPKSLRPKDLREKSKASQKKS